MAKKIKMNDAAMLSWIETHLSSFREFDNDDAGKPIYIMEWIDSKTGETHEIKGPSLRECIENHKIKLEKDKKNPYFGSVTSHQ